MGGEALVRKIVTLSAAMALATGCSPLAMSPRDASAAREGPEGTAEAQSAAQTAPPTPVAPAPSTGDAIAPRHPGPAPTEAGTDGSDPGRDPHRMRRVLGWISLSIGAEAAVVALVTSILIEHQKGVRDDNCNARKVCTAVGFGAVSTIETIVPWNTASWFVAAAGLGAGAVLLITSPESSQPPTAITLAPNASGLALGVRSTF